MLYFAKHPAGSRNGTKQNKKSRRETKQKTDAKQKTRYRDSQKHHQTASMQRNSV